MSEDLKKEHNWYCVTHRDRYYLVGDGSEVCLCERYPFPKKEALEGGKQ